MAGKNIDTPGIELELKLLKETKGTYVYTMVSNGIECGSVYLPKLLFTAGKPGIALSMRITS